MIISSSTAAIGAAATKTTSVGFVGEAAKSDPGNALAEFKKLASESPYQRIADSVLKRHGMDSDSFAKMPAGPEKDAIRKEMTDAVRRSLGAGDTGSASTYGATGAGSQTGGFSIELSA